MIGFLVNARGAGSPKRGRPSKVFVAVCLETPVGPPRPKISLIAELQTLPLLVSAVAGAWAT
jgi:hypothetical protein